MLGGALGCYIQGMSLSRGRYYSASTVYYVAGTATSTPPEHKLQIKACHFLVNGILCM